MDAELTAEVSDLRPALESGEKHLETWIFRTTEPENQNQIRLKIPADSDPEKLRVAIRDASGSWREAQYHMSGSYAVAPLQAGDDAIALVQTGSVLWLVIGVATAAMAALVWIFRTWKKTIE
jgi:hypothetical protein